MRKLRCKKCKIDISRLSKDHLAEHKDGKGYLCCDCFDEGFGMPEESRAFCKICHNKQPAHKLDCPNRQ